MACCANTDEVQGELRVMKSSLHNGAGFCYRKLVTLFNTHDCLSVCSITVNLMPRMLPSMMITTSLMSGEVIKKAMVIPMGMRAETTPTKRGIELQEQNGVIAPNIAPRKYPTPSIFSF